jgi:ATP-dependent Clp protease ATP-binding subunit ClpX
MATPNKLECSFCGKTKENRVKLVVGPTVCICNECVDLARDILNQDDERERKLRTGLPA